MRFSRFLPLLAASMTASFSGVAQNYRPFSPGRTYHYRAPGPAGRADTIYTLRVDSTYAVGTDTGYFFNHTYRINSYGVIVNPRNQPERLNFFGGWMRWNPATGVATFGSPYGTQSVVIRTRVGVGASWAFTPTVQATVVSRQVALQMGQPDTVLTVALSDGQTLRLARRFGFLEGPALAWYLGRLADAPVTAPRQLRLAALPEAGLVGIAPLTWPSIYNLQPGDSLFYAQRQWGYPMGFNCPPDYDRRWTTVSVVTSHRITPAGLTVVGMISIDSSGVTGSDTLMIGPDNPLLTYAPFSRSPFTGPLQSTVRAAFIHPDTLAGLPVAEVVGYNPDYMMRRRYAPGLGIVYNYMGGGVNCFSATSSRLIGFVKNNGTLRWGITTPPPIATGLAAEIRPLPATLAPNPADAAETPELNFHLEKAQAATLALYDATGREVWRRQEQLSGGEQRLPIGPRALAPGLYRLRLTLADGRQRVLPLARQ